MCGLIASFSKSNEPNNAIRLSMQQMVRRGPDGEGFWHEGGVTLGHRRLAIVDLDSRAGQPMLSSCGRYAIVFNGEIYNYRELRRDLEEQGHEFRTSSDTEVILALFASEGEACLTSLHGMFAFVIWDKIEEKAFAARDPYGIKPLYIARITGGLMLGSQVKALLATGLVSREPDAKGQAGFWLLGSVPEPHTWYRDISNLPAGHYAWIENGQISSQYCWSDIGQSWRTAVSTGIPAREIHERVRAALKESVERHLVADVPVGVFLSGGIDSGALAGLMVEAGARDLVGVTISFDEFSGRHQDEAPVAARIAAYYGIHHHIRKVDKWEFEEDLPRILGAMDQPSIDGINTWYASKAVAELGLKVVVSGVGGDELFQGYGSFRQLPRLVSAWRPMSRVPGAMALAQVLANRQARRTGNCRWRASPKWAQTISGAWWLRRSSRGPDDLAALMGEELAAEAMLGFAAEKWVQTMAGPLPVDSVLAIGQIESMTYLRNQLLRDSDWASMDHSVELRTPLVDAHLLQTLAPLLSSFAKFPGKTLLADAPTKPLPLPITNRKKTGFGIPVNQWLGNDSALNGQRGWDCNVAAAFECTFE